MEHFFNGRVTLHGGDAREVLRGFESNSFDSIVTDPPYALVSIVKRFGKQGSAPAKGNEAFKRASAGFMGQAWDTGETAFAVEFWAECLRVLKPGGHVVAFSGTRTYHRMACAIEDAGFEIRDQLQWVYGSGFPKSHDVAKGLDKAAGHWRGRAGAITIEEQPAKGTEYERTDKGEPITDSAIQWQGWGTALKPACEPICFARKPLIGTVAANVLAHGTGAINIDGCRVGTAESTVRTVGKTSGDGWGLAGQAGQTRGTDGIGRWPANILHDGSDEVLAAFPETHAAGTCSGRDFKGWESSGELKSKPIPNDSGSAARFFYTAKADANDRLGSKHPTVKPVDLMQWLCRLVTPKGGKILDPFAGTGTTAEAAFREGMSCTLIEREPAYQDDIRRRMRLVMAGPDERSRESIKAKQDKPLDAGPLFGGLE